MESPQLRLLGPFACLTRGREVELPQSAQRLLAILALQGPVPRSLLAGSLRPETSEARALASLRTGVWRVTKSLPGLVHVHGGVIALAQDTWVDSREQERFALRVLHQEAGDPDSLRSGLHLLAAGSLLPGWDEAWVVGERERLGQLRLHALEAAVRLLTRQGDLDTALTLALDAVRTEPLRETANALLVTVYLAEGNVSDALRHYRAFRDLLRHELGVEPSEPFTALLPRCRALDRVAAVPTR